MDDFLVFYVTVSAVYLLASTIAYGFVVGFGRLHDRLKARKRPMATRNKA